MPTVTGGITQVGWKQFRLPRHVAAALSIGLLIREIFSFWTGHPFDFELWVRLGYGMVHGGDPYNSLPAVAGLSFANIYYPQNTATIAYLPFWPIITGLMYILYSAVGFGNRFVYYFLLKQPVIIGDITLAYLLYSYISSKTSKQVGSIWALRLWAFSPFTILISGIWGMFDALAMSFILISLMAVSPWKRNFWIGLGIFTKALVIVYAIPAAFRKHRRVRTLLSAFAFPAAASFLTITLMGWSLSPAAITLLSATGKGGASMSAWDILDYLGYLGIQPPSITLYRVLGFVWIPAILAFTMLAFRKLGFETDYGLLQSMLVATLVFLIFKARVTEQYAIYLLALAAIDVAIWSPGRKRLFVITMTVALFYLVVNNYFLVRFLSPVYPDYTNFELALGQFELIRRTVLLLSGTVFTILNISYLTSILRDSGRLLAGKQM
jgi:hypothetical protein